MNREAIYAAAFARISTIAGFNTTSRRLKHWADVPAIDQPSAFFVQNSELAANATRMPSRWTLSAEILLYANAGGDKNLIPQQTLNPLIDAICAAFTIHPDGSEQTLDGLVERCRIEGMAHIFEGVLEDQAVVSLQLTIFLGSS